MKSRRDPTAFAREAENQQALQQLAEVFLLPSLVEGLSLSLLEAMAASAVICAHDNPFNREVLGDNGFFFKDQAGVAGVINMVFQESDREKAVRENLDKIRDSYQWGRIIGAYEKLFTGLLHDKAKGHGKVQDEKGYD